MGSMCRCRRAFVTAGVCLSWKVPVDRLGSSVRAVAHVNQLAVEQEIAPTSSYVADRYLRPHRRYRGNCATAVSPCPNACTRRYMITSSINNTASISFGDVKN